MLWHLEEIKKCMKKMHFSLAIAGTVYLCFTYFRFKASNTIKPVSVDFFLTKNFQVFRNLQLLFQLAK